MDSILSEMLFIVLLAGVILFKVTRAPYRWKSQYKQAIGTHSKVTTTV